MYGVPCCFAPTLDPTLSQMIPNIPTLVSQDTF